MSDKSHVPFTPETPDMQDFMKDVFNTVRKQPDVTGIGGHGPDDHGGHGPHSQLNIGLPGTTVDIRFPIDKP